MKKFGAHMNPNLIDEKEPAMWWSGEEHFIQSGQQIQKFWDVSKEKQGDDCDWSISEAKGMGWRGWKKPNHGGAVDHDIFI